MTTDHNAADAVDRDGARELICQANALESGPVIRRLGFTVAKGNRWECPKCRSYPASATFKSDDDINPGKRWRCTAEGCDAGGSIVDLIARHKGLSDANAARFILGEPLAVEADHHAGDFFTSTNDTNTVEKEMPVFVGRETRAEIEVMSNGSTRAAVRPRGSDERQEVRIMNDQNAVDASCLIAAETTLDAAKAALKAGLRPIPIYAIGEEYKTQCGIKVSDGKPPIGGSWGKRTWTDASLEKTFGQNQGRNVGLLMGPQGGIIDIEMDRTDDMDVETFDRLADEELAELCGGEIPETVGWRSGRGVHRIFLWDDRLGACEKNAFKHGRLEIRLGAAKQIQSVIPPSSHATGERAWLDGPKTIASLPDVAIERIIEAAKPKPKEVEPPAAKAKHNGHTGAMASDAKFYAALAAGESIPDAVTKRDSERYEEERLLGQARALAQNILNATKGDTNTGRHPTALRMAKTMSGLIAGHGRDDLAGACRGILIEAYRDSKPELNRDDPEFEQCISDGWNYGAGPGNAITLDEREKPGVKPGTAESQARVDQKSEGARPFGGLDLGPPATLATFRARAAAREFLWDYWIAKRCLNLIDGTPGVGKSRFVMDLLRRIRHGEMWPDKRPMKQDDRTRFLWVAADSNYDQLVETATAFGIDDDALIFPGDESRPYDFTDLTDIDTIQAIETRLATEKPEVMVIDTATNACGDKQQMDRTEIGRIAKQLAKMANEHNVAVVLIGHQNARGGSYGDSWPANVDSRIKMEDDGDAVRFELVKSRWDKLKAPVMRGRQSDEGWTFEVEPRDIELPRSLPGETLSVTGRAKRAIADYVTRYPSAKKTDVAKRIGEITSISRSSVYAALKEMIEDSEVIESIQNFGSFEAPVLDIGRSEKTGDA